MLIEALATRKVVETAPPLLLEACAGYLLQLVYAHMGRFKREPTHVRLTLDEFIRGAQLSASALQERSEGLLDLVWPPIAEQTWDEGRAGAPLEVRAAVEAYEREGEANATARQAGGGY